MNSITPGIDVIWGYRWFGGPGDNTLHVGYGGLGIQDLPMADADDLGYLRGFGIRHSLTWLGQER